VGAGDRQAWPGAGATEFLEACTPGYYNREGAVTRGSAALQNSAFAPGINAFNALLAKWREDGRSRGDGAALRGARAPAGSPRSAIDGPAMAWVRRSQAVRARAHGVAGARMVHGTRRRR
jgi:hypothetical protein